MISVLVAVLLMLLSQQQPWFGIASCGRLGTALLSSTTPSGSDQVVARFIERFSPNTITAVLVGVAGITFLVKAGGGLYWLLPAAVASLVGGVVNAWLFLVRVTG